MTAIGRPRLHLTARRGWINDPLGLTWHDGRYHVFFQYVPERTSWAPDCRWGHAVGTDLVNWKELEPALEPDDGDDGVWSGSLAVDSDDRAAIFYTSVRLDALDQGSVRLARPDDRTWRTWTKGPRVVEAPNSPATSMFRDPFVFRDGSIWRMLVGGSTAGPTAVAFGYSSHDLESWTFEGIAAERASARDEPLWTGDGWECPQLIEVDGVHVLVTSVWEPDGPHHVAAATGTWADGRFTAERWQPLTEGPGYYAPSVFRDRDGRPALVFWIQNVIEETEGWAGAMSVPHLMSVVDGVLVLRPHPDVIAAGEVIEASVDDARDGSVVSVNGPTLVRSCAPQTGSLRVVEDGASDVLVRFVEGDLSLEVGGEVRARVPRADHRLELLVDGSVLELWHGPSVRAATRKVVNIGGEAGSRPSAAGGQP